jgi:hypothetical protein
LVGSDFACVGTSGGTHADDDGRDKSGGVALLVRKDGQPVKRQHRAVAEVETGQRGCEDQQRLALEKHGT